ncbi:MAG: YbaB/EbfC family nucleoid-associated protein [bacterium]|nr:YbaB/EbfC family nucleoid-associated protein [bacterium]
MFGKLGDMMGKLQEMKQRAEETKKRLAEKVILISGAGGDVQVEITGDRKVTKLIISAALQHGDTKELELNLLVTLNKALTEVEKINEEELKKAASGLLPGL